MRIRDATITKQTQHATQALLCVSRCRSAGKSNLFTAFFLEEVRYGITEVALQHARKTVISMNTFSLDCLDDSECLKRFRFTKKDMARLIALLPWSDERNITKRRRYRTTSVLSICILTRRLATANRWWDLECEFFVTTPRMNEIFYEALEYVYDTLGGLLSTYRDAFIQSRATEYAQAIHDAGAPLESCVGFIDGTNIFIARPTGRAQRATYSGHKRRNCVKLQALSLPDGLIFHLFGPEEGRRHDMTLFRHSGIEADLARSLVVGGRQFYIYGDPAYVLRPYLQIGFRGSTLTDEEKEFNKQMSAVRVSVEWAFKDIKKYFTHVDTPRKLALKSTPAGLWYYVSTLMWNFRACCYGSQSATFFACKAPTLEEYIGALLDN